MIKEFLREIVSWLGYLQRGSVLIQITFIVVAFLIDKRYIQRQSNINRDTIIDHNDAI